MRDGISRSCMRDGSSRSCMRDGRRRRGAAAGAAAREGGERGMRAARGGPGPASQQRLSPPAAVEKDGVSRASPVSSTLPSATPPQVWSCYSGFTHSVSLVQVTP